MKRTEPPQDTSLDTSAVLAKAVEDLDRAVRSARERSREWEAWTALQRVDEHGLTEVQPYNGEAIAILDAAFSTDDSDCHVIHHLAIAYHAMAWDLESSDPGAADRAWESALFFWRKLQGCSQFWEQLHSKGERLGSVFDANALAELRRNLLPYLYDGTLPYYTKGTERNLRMRCTRYCRT